MCEVVVKIGGSLLEDVARLDDTLDAVRVLASRRSLLVIPGGGVFADGVRAVDHRIGIADDAAHWMAVLAMDQYAHLLAARLGRGDVVFSAEDAQRVSARSDVPVLAPYRWLYAVDPLPHTWDVTSDSIAAWIAGACGARELIVVKSAGARRDVVDSYFESVRPLQARVTIVPADRVREVFDQLAGSDTARRGTASPAL